MLILADKGGRGSLINADISDKMLKNGKKYRLLINSSEV